MDKHIEELFEDAQPFDEGELYQTPEYDLSISVNLDSYYEVERFNCLHYFYQGYLAAKAEGEQKKDLT